MSLRMEFCFKERRKEGQVEEGKLNPECMRDQGCSFAGRA